MIDGHSSVEVCTDGICSDGVWRLLFNELCVLVVATLPNDDIEAAMPCEDAVKVTGTVIGWNGVK